MNFVGIVETDEIFDESWTIKMPWERLKADYRGWHAIIQTVIDEADKDKCYRWSLHNRLPISNWSTARVTLLGDSAHATLPYLAQGAVMAIEDGAVLARALAMESEIPKALQLYTAVIALTVPPRSSSSRAITVAFFICAQKRICVRPLPVVMKAPTGITGSTDTIP